ncbi:MAG: hypothetical protein ACHP84_21170 [Caulobacterales bacterium]
MRAWFRHASTAAIVAAVGLISFAAPAWPGCVPMGGSSSSGGNPPASGSSQSDASTSSSSGDNQGAGGGSGYSTGSGSTGEDHHQGSDSSRDNGPGEGARQGAENAAGAAIDNGDSGGGRRSSDAQQSQGLTNQIGGVAQAQAADNIARCRELKAKLADVVAANSDPDEITQRATQLYNRAIQMTPAMLDAEIARRKDERDERIWRESSDRAYGYGGPYPNQSYDATLTFLMNLRASQATGFDQEGPKHQYLDAIAKARVVERQRQAERDAKIRDLQAQIHDLSCGYEPTADQSVPPGTVSAPDP